MSRKSPYLSRGKIVSSVFVLGLMLLYMLYKTNLLQKYFISVKLKINITQNLSVNDCYQALGWLPPLASVTFESSKPLLTHPYVTVNFQGRIGNLMFQYASLLGICNITNCVPLIPSQLEIVEYFGNIYNTLPACAEPEQWRLVRYSPIPKIKEQEPKSFDQTLISFIKTNVSSDRVLQIDGYLQSWRYFEHISDFIWKQFHFESDTSRRLTQHLEALKVQRNADYIVGIHIRRGDYIKNPELYALADEAYMLKAMKYYSDKYGAANTLFLVCSTADGLDWFKTDVDFKLYKVEFCQRRAPIEDLRLLSLTDNMIITVGTFGWWAGYFNKGTVVYYRNIWPGTLTAEQHQLLDNFFPPHWISM